jgi:hypothetical protein
MIYAVGTRGHCAKKVLNKLTLCCILDEGSSFETGL